MGHKKAKANYRRIVLRLPDLDHSKMAVLNRLTSPASRRVYKYAIEKFVAWYCSEPRIAHYAGLLSPDLAAGIARVKGVKQLGQRSGNGLTQDQSADVLRRTRGESPACQEGLCNAGHALWLRSPALGTCWPRTR
jgi:hypothetical protein